MAAGIGAVPIPSPDPGRLLALEGALLARIAVAMRIEFDGALFQGQAASMLLKAIPGVGSAISATFAAALTATLGELYIAPCSEFLRRTAAGKLMPGAEMLECLMDEFKSNYRRQVRPG